MIDRILVADVDTEFQLQRVMQEPGEVTGFNVTLAADNQAAADEACRAIEAIDSQRQRLGTDGLAVLVASRRDAGPLSLEDLLSALLEHAEGKFADDVALLLVRRCAAT